MRLSPAANVATSGAGWTRVNGAIALRLWLLLAVLFVCVGCGSVHELPTGYGKRNGPNHRNSVNGTMILSEMFVASGSKVSSWERLSPRLDQADTIVWFPDDYDSPSREARNFLENWLSRRTGRTLVVVGRDFDASADYWEQIVAIVPPNQLPEVMRKLATAKAEHDANRSEIEPVANIEWATIKADRRRRVSQLQGPWSDGVEANQAAIWLDRRLNAPEVAENSTAVSTTPSPPPTPAPQVAPPTRRTRRRVVTVPPKSAKGTPNSIPVAPSNVFGWGKRQINWEPLLTSDGETLIAKVTSPSWNTSQILLVNNGSYLLNYSLINHEHRKLANRLVAECGTGRRVMFLESGEGGPPVVDKDTVAKQPTGFEALTTWPLGAIIMHLTVLGIVACFVFYPIFGSPHNKAADEEGEQAEITDFAVHLEAVAELLEQTKDKSFAQGQVATYNQTCKRQSHTTPSLTSTTVEKPK